MPRPTENPPISSRLRMQLMLVCAVLVATGGGLFFLSHEMQAMWPWPVGQFDMRFLGATYLASLVVVGLLFWYPFWLPARVVLPMLFVFTATVLLVSIMYLGRFDFSRSTAWGWFLLHAGLVLAASLNLWRYRDVPPPINYATPGPWRALLLLLAACLGLYGAGMFLAPGAFTAFWPWAVDTFHGRLYSVIFTTAAAGALGLTLVAAPVERLTVGAAYCVLGLFAAFGAIIADARLRSLDIGSPSTWLWFGIFGALFFVGLLLVNWSSTGRQAEP